MSKSLLKLLDNALLPASLMVVSKFVGVFFIISIFNLTWSVQETPNNIFSFQTLLSSQDVILVTSYSDLIMFSVLALGFSFTIFRSIFFTSSKINIKILNNFATRNLLSLIESSYEIYHTAFVWLVFMLLSSIFTISNLISGVVYPWVGVLVTLVSLLLTIIFLQDVYKEVENARNHPGKYLNS